ncbi:centrosomal protein 43-like [Argiope bruennichi]|uniref:centrosomal protein 43-like n=1 Tax=Argiope bruennichi TaxID=94029 RepID=UPI0024953774|nr:centrosomal protein 43-like [Argiope bruennichi]
MYAEGETELRDLIIQNLETCGFLNKIKAELRAGVLLAFEEERNLRSKIPLFNKKFDEFVEKKDGKLVVSLVREFLEYFNLNFTISVFDPEIATSSPYLNRTDLCKELNLRNTEFDGPVISALLKNKPSFELEKVSQSLSSEKTTSFSASIHTSLETISEDSPVKEKNGFENLTSNDSVSTSAFPSLKFDNSGKNMLSEENIKAKQKTSTSDTFRKSNSSIIEKLKNESSSLEMFDKEKTKISDVFTNEKSSSIFKEKESSLNLEDDSFFDDPIPSEKPSFLNLPSENPFTASSFKDNTQNKSNGSALLGTEKSTLSSLKDLPALTTKGKDWNFSSAELPKTLPSLDTKKLASSSEKFDNKEMKEDEKEDIVKKDPDLESTEESSDHQLNSDESIEEELEGDFSAGLDDLLNSSLSLGDDATSDQTVSQISVVDGVDHVEPVKN